MHESGVLCAGRISFGATFRNDVTENVQGAKLVLFADDANLLISREVEFDNMPLKHGICACRY
jgi:hypothetical protein